LAYKLVNLRIKFHLEINDSFGHIELDVKNIFEKLIEMISSL